VPNTLVHFAAQGTVSRGLWRRLDPRWIYLGCLLPDVPWILRRVAVAAGLALDPVDVRLYTMAQASLAGTLLLCGALALATLAPRLVFATLGTNALLHLLLDACEVKWGNGVHLFAPFSWRMTSFDLVSGQSTAVLALTVAGALLVAGEIVRPPLPTIGLARRRRRLLAASGLLAAYIVVPLPFLGAIEASDSYSVKVMREAAQRAGRTVRFDRTAFRATPAGGFVEAWTGERLRAVGDVPDHDAQVSLVGTFLAPDVLRVDRLAEHRQDRDWPSYLALVLLALLWVRPHLPGRAARGPAARDRSPGP